MSQSLPRRTFLTYSAATTLGLAGTALLAACGGAAAATTTTVTQMVTKATVSVSTATVAKTSISTATVTSVQTTQAPPQARVAVHMAIGDTGGLVPPWDQAATIFTQKETGLTVTITPGLGGGKVLAQIAGGGGPDLFQVDSTGALGGYVLKKAVVDLTSYYARDSRDLLKKFLPQTVNIMTVSGKQYAVAETVTSSGLYYNKRLLQEAGQAFPSATWTWNDLLRAAEKLTKRTPQGLLEQTGYIPDSITLSWSTGPTTWVWSNGGSFFNADQSKFTLGEPAAVQALQSFTDMLFKYKVSPTNADVKAASLRGPWDFMYQARGGMWECPSWNAYLTQQNNGNQDPKLWQDLWIAPTPRSPYVSQPAAEFAFSRMTVMNVNTKVKDAAWTFATFLTTDDDAILTGAMKNAGMPALPEKFFLWFKFVGSGRGQHVFTKNVTQARYAEHLQSNPAADQEIWKLLNDGWSKVLQQKEDVSAFIGSVSSPIEKLLAGSH